MLTEGEILRSLAEFNKKCEGSCRQMAYWRGDTRWLQMGEVYAKMAQKATALATRRTGHKGTLILPPGHQ